MTQAIKNTALLIMDVQAGVVDRIAHMDDYLDQIKRTVEIAHQLQIPVIYVVVSFRSGLPEVSARNKSFSQIKHSFPAQLIDSKPVLTLQDSDIIVTKHRVSAFSGSDLDLILRAQNIEHLVLSGIATSGVVLSTLREAADNDFQLTVLSDLCADFDDEVHNVLLEKVFPKQAEVMTSTQWINKNTKTGE